MSRNRRQGLLISVEYGVEQTFSAMFDRPLNHGQSRLLGRNDPDVLKNMAEKTTRLCLRYHCG